MTKTTRYTFFCTLLIVSCNTGNTTSEKQVAQVKTNDINIEGTWIFSPYFDGIKATRSVTKNRKKLLGFYGLILTFEKDSCRHVGLFQFVNTVAYKIKGVEILLDSSSRIFDMSDNNYRLIYKNDRILAYEIKEDTQLYHGYYRRPSAYGIYL